MLKWDLDTNGLLVPALCLVALHLPLLSSLFWALGRNSPASSLSFWQCECWDTYARYMPFLLLQFLQFITCRSVTKPFSYVYWMRETTASTLRGTFRGRILTDTTKWRQQKMLSVFFVTWKQNKAVRLISKYFEVLKNIDLCCFSVVPAKPC